MYMHKSLLAFFLDCTLPINFDSLRKTLTHDHLFLLLTLPCAHCVLHSPHVFPRPEVEFYFLTVLIVILLSFMLVDAFTDM